MAWVAPTTRTLGDLITAAIWNQDVVANTIALEAGGLPAADYDSGWFAVAHNTTYTKAHGLGTYPRLVVVEHSTSSTGASERVTVMVGKKSAADQFRSMQGADATNVYVQTNTDSSAGVLYSTRRESASGYYRVLAWI